VRVRVIWFGRPGGSPYEEQVEVYRRRVAHRWPSEDLPVRPGRHAGDPLETLAEEAAFVRRLVPDRWAVVALDRRGRVMSSEELAADLAGREAAAVPGLAFVVGSDLGLDRTLVREADLSLSLSALTLPHLLARLLLWEQLYRATQIIIGGGYHRQALQ
jgi:23S rRNA (pseudouridine1915-N3)-methyltransferase